MHKLLWSVWSCAFFSTSLSTCSSTCADKVRFVMPKKCTARNNRDQRIERQLIDSWPHVEDPISLLFLLTPFTETLAFFLNTTETLADGTHLLHS